MTALELNFGRLLFGNLQHAIVLEHVGFMPWLDLLWLPSSRVYILKLLFLEFISLGELAKRALSTMAARALFASLLVFLVAAVIVESVGARYYVDSPTDYVLLNRLWRKGPERAQCIGRNRKCRFRVLNCPQQCPDRKSLVKGKQSCFIDCSPKCEATCRKRKANCYGYGSMCYDPRFVGGDGVMFYFHGMAGKDFAIVSDHNMQINAHFIGKRVENRTRDYTWVQSLGLMFGMNSFTVGAKKVGTWDDSIDQLVFSFNGEPVVMPEGQSATWVSESGDVKIERIADTNGVDVVVDKLMAATINVVPITEKENKIHNYQLTSEDCFAHLDIQFKFFNLSSTVEGVLGQTYQPDFHNPVKVGVPMPIMGGEDRFQVSSLLSADCKSCKFAAAESNAKTEAASQTIEMVTSTQCTSSSNGGMMCRR